MYNIMKMMNIMKATYFGYMLRTGVDMSVPDHESRDCDVVLVKRTIQLGKPLGAGNLEWGGDEEGEVSLQATWGQAGQDRITPKEGFQVSESAWKRELTRNW